MGMGLFGSAHECGRPLTFFMRAAIPEKIEVLGESQQDVRHVPLPEAHLRRVLDKHFEDVSVFYDVRAIHSVVHLV